MVRTGRPKKDRAGKARSIYFSPESEAFIEGCGPNTNVSDLINSLIKAAGEQGLVMMAIRIERLSKEIAALEEKTFSARTERDLLQAQLNIAKERKTGEDRLVHESRMTLLRKWDQAKGHAGQFSDWLTGPANMHLIIDSGFGTAMEAADWCRTEARRR